MPPSVAERERGVVHPDCVLCWKLINTTPEFLDHLQKVGALVRANGSAPIALNLSAKI
jgi:hypothetical protein